MILFSGCGTVRETSLTEIVDYNPTAHREFILELISSNWYWLVSGNKPFDAAYFLDHKAPYKDPIYEGLSQIKVLEVNHKPCGFVAYNLEPESRGRIHFLVIDTMCRSKGYSKILINYAINQLRDLGVVKIFLTTRTENEIAHILYKRYGFKPTAQNNAYVRFERIL